MNDNQTYIPIGLFNQSFPQTNASIMLGSKPLKIASIFIVTIHKTEFDVEVDIGIAKISKAIALRVGKFWPLICHQPNMSNSPSERIRGTHKYLSSSSLREPLCDFFHLSNILRGLSPYKEESFSLLTKEQDSPDC